MIEKLKLLEENLKVLQDMKNALTLDVLKKDKTKEWALRYGLYECIQIVIDIACYLVSKYNLGNPKSYSECIEYLERYEYLSENMGEKLKKMVGLRNLLAHEYIKIDLLKLLNFLKNLDDFREFVNSIKKFI